MVLGIDREDPGGADEQVVDVLAPDPERDGVQDPPPAVHACQALADLHFPQVPDGPRDDLLDGHGRTAAGRREAGVQVSELGEDRVPGPLHREVGLAGGAVTTHSLSLDTPDAEVDRQGLRGAIRSVSWPGGTQVVGQVALQFTAAEAQLFTSQLDVGQPSGFDLVVHPVLGDLEQGTHISDGEQVQAGAVARFRHGDHRGAG